MTTAIDDPQMAALEQAQARLDEITDQMSTRERGLHLAQQERGPIEQEVTRLRQQLADLQHQTVAGHDVSVERAEVRRQVIEVEAALADTDGIIANFHRQIHTLEADRREAERLYTLARGELCFVEAEALRDELNLALRDVEERYHTLASKIEEGKTLCGRQLPWLDSFRHELKHTTVSSDPRRIKLPVVGSPQYY